jgi:hypothetical protein
VKSIKVKILVVLAVNLVLFVTGFFVLSWFAESRLNATRAQYQLSSTDLAFYKKYTAVLNHVREPHFLFHLPPDIARTTSDLLFTKTGNEGPTILIQGDSWAEQFVTSLGSYVRLEQFADKHKVKFVNGGVASYSPSLMAIQYRILRDEFQINPKVVIALIDQTDIADELCRYRNVLSKNNNGDLIARPFPITEKHPFSPLHYLDLVETLDADENALIRLLRYKYKKDFLSPPPTKSCSSYDQMVSPLKGTLTHDDGKYFVDRLKQYISAVLQDVNSPEYLFFVTHHHRGHVSGEFSLNVSLLVKQVIEQAEFGDRIIHLEFTPEDYVGMKMDDIFKHGDLFSHLTNSTHRRVYATNILKKLSGLLGQQAD